MKTKQKLVPVSLVLMTMAGTGFAANETPMPAQTEPPSPIQTPAADEWQFAVTLPLWAPQIDGNVTLAGHQQDLNVSFSDLKDHLDASFSLAANAQKGKLGIFGNVGYMKFSGGFPDAAGGHADAGLKFLVANAGLSYQLIKTESEHPFVITGTAGVRFWYVSTSLSHHDSSGTRDWHGYNNYNLFDPVIGLRASQFLTRKLHIDVAGDGGGFNLSHDTDWTWSVSGMVTYDFTKRFSLSAGYQALAIDESEGAGGDKHGVNLIFNGVAAAATFKF
jgi:hypothetical protein